MKKQLLLIAALAYAGGSCRSAPDRPPPIGEVAGACFTVVTHGSSPDGHGAPMVGDHIANDSLRVLLERIPGPDSQRKGPIDYLLNDSMASHRGRATWYLNTPDSLSVFWGKWPDFFVVETKRKASEFEGRAYYKDDGECGNDRAAAHCWRGTASLTPVSCGPMSWPLAGAWIALLSYGGMMDDTLSYTPDQDPNRRWILTLTENGTFTSQEGDHPPIDGTVALARDSVAPNRIVLLAFAPGLRGDEDAAFYPELRGDMLILRNAWTDAYDHVFIRRR